MRPNGVVPVVNARDDEREGEAGEREVHRVVRLEHSERGGNRHSRRCWRRMEMGAGAWQTAAGGDGAGNVARRSGREQEREPAILRSTRSSERPSGELALRDSGNGRRGAVGNSSPSRR